MENVKKKLELAFQLHQKGSLKEAKKIYAEIISENADHSEALMLQGTLFIQLNLLVDAEKSLLKSIQINNDHFLAHQNLGLVYIKNDNWKEALQCLTRAIQLAPENFNTLYYRAKTLIELNLFDAAMIDLNKTISLNPDFAEAYHSRGIIFYKLQNFNEANLDFKKSHSIDPNFADNYFYFGLIAIDLKSWDEAIRQLNTAIKINRDHYKAYYNLGNTFMALNNFEEAKKNYFKAYSINTSKWYINYNLGIMNLIQGDYSLGWKMYEWRKNNENFKTPNILLNIKNYKGEKKGRLLVWAEQGIGDQIFYLSMLQNLPNTLKIEVVLDERLKKLFERSFPKIIFKSDETNYKKYDFAILSPSLGMLYRNKIHDLRKYAVPYLHADLRLTQEYKKKFSATNKITCGLSWSSKDSKSSERKSLTLKQLLPKINSERLNFVDLQYGDTDAEILDLKSSFNISIQSDSKLDKFNDIDKLAALIDACDIIITIGNITAHIAGALGKKVFLLLPYGYGVNNVWYWQTNSESNWYKSITIIRQNELDNWEPAIAQLTKHLSIYLKK